MQGTDLAVIYYLPGAAGWSQEVYGKMPVAWNPQFQAGAGFGKQGNGEFGFCIAGANGMSVAVEACTNLAGAVWTPITTVTIDKGTATFTDTNSINYHACFYRFRMP